jgi:peptidyl-prolyl cis-trans isomerase D
MFAAIRAFAKSWVAAILIGLLIISFAVFQIHDVFRAGPRGSVISAGTRSVSADDFKREFDAFRRNAEQQTGQAVTPEIIEQNHLDARVLEGLAGDVSFSELLRKIGVRPSDKLTISKLREIPAFFNQVSGRFDEKLYQQRLGENGFTPATFEQSVRDQIAERHLATGLLNGLKVPRAYTALAAIYGLESRDLGYFPVGPETVPAPALPTDAQLVQFMKENEADLKRPELRILTVVRFSPASVAQTLPIDEADLKKRYEFRKDTLSSPETRSLVQIPAKDAAAAQQIVARLAKGEAPAAVAKAVGVDAIIYVDKPQSAIPDRSLAAAAFAMQPGQTSVLKGDLGSAVVRVTKATPGHAVTLEEIRPQLEAELRKDAAAEKVYEMTQAYDDAHTAGSSLTEAAAKAGAATFTMPPLSRQGVLASGQPVQGLPPKLLEQAFALPAGGESEVEEAGGGEYYAVKVDKVIAPAMPSLGEIRPLLTRVWMGREMAKRLTAKADQLADRVRKGESLEAVAGTIGAHVTRAAGLDRTNAAENKVLSRDALGKAFSAKAGEVFTADDIKFGLIVAKLEGLRPGGGPNLARMTEDARPQMSLALFRELGESARRAARSEAKVKVDANAARTALGLEPLPTEREKAKGKAGTSK